MHLIDDKWYYLPDGKLVQAHAVGTAPDWYLLTDPRGITCYGVYTFGLRQFVYDRELGDYHGISSQLTLSDLRPAEWNAATLWHAHAALAPVPQSRARQRTRSRG
jgi:hypothetical protein